MQDGLAVGPITLLKENFKTMLRDVFCTFKRRYMEYRRLCRETNQSCYGPNFDVPTRWNSTWKMFDSAVRQKQTLQLFHDSLAEANYCEPFQSVCWNSIVKLTDLLNVFKDATTILSGVYYPTSDKVLQQLYYTSNKLNDTFQITQYKSLIILYKTCLIFTYLNMVCHQTYMI